MELPVDRAPLERIARVPRVEMHVEVWNAVTVHLVVELDCPRDFLHCG